LGGPGDDVILGTTLFGGPGDDLLMGRLVNGGTGSDTLIGHVVDYSDRRESVFVSLNGLRDDGEAGEGDLVVATDVLGGAGDDVISGDAQANFIAGGRGRDLVFAGGGDDWIVGGPASQADCGFADCWGPGSRCVPGVRDGRDRIHGGAGDDDLLGCRGKDELVGGAGDDTFRARDGFKDTLRGSRGTDRARIDVGLDVVVGVERLF